MLLLTFTTIKIQAPASFFLRPREVCLNGLVILTLKSGLRRSCFDDTWHRSSAAWKSQEVVKGEVSAITYVHVYNVTKTLKAIEMTYFIDSTFVFLGGKK